MNKLVVYTHHISQFKYDVGRKTLKYSVSKIFILEVNMEVDLNSVKLLQISGFYFSRIIE